MSEEEQVETLEISKPQALSDLFKLESQEILSSLSPLTPEKQKNSFHAIQEMGKALPEATLVGGWALRLHLNQRGLPIPSMKALDIDYVIGQDNYDRVRDTFIKPTQEVFVMLRSRFTSERREVLKHAFRRKGNHEPVPVSMGGGFRSFMKNPHNYMALEDNIGKQHIDLFVENAESDKQFIDLDGTKVSVLSPEEIFLRRIDQIQRELKESSTNAAAKPELPRKVYQYFILNGAILNEDHLRKLVEERKGISLEEILNFSQDLQRRIKNNEVNLVDVYH